MVGQYLRLGMNHQDGKVEQADGMLWDGQLSDFQEFALYIACQSRIDIGQNALFI